ncbi:cytochrome c oxidase subunit II [Coraliomargarita sp. SDUM461004]|uniref:cytochrome-c oxidase n=1 Tax=Thalassobacterium sedimentorum TaxID=3041258 RepID=A0ABU1AHG3_9BACT|nr:cytochrome c oxidase subunit II [Coraliomargarita sp. SDUM461004]MDQ8194255.1 cytochrome c oxidase subunit II [Coraliomargarita sp. SDUM461004]
MKTISNGFYRFLQYFSAFIVVTVLGGCNLDTRMSTFVTKGPIAEEQLNLFMLTVWVTFAIFIIVGGVFVYAVIKFRERPNDDRPMPSQGHGNPLVEIGLIGASILLLAVIAVPTLQAIWFTQETPDDVESRMGAWYSGEELAEEEAENPLIIKVIGYQWWWAFEYPQLGITTANEMVIPAGKVVHLELRSVDVIHSFWLPRIAGKVDLIPGRTNAMWIQAGDNFAKWKEKQGIVGPDQDSPELREGYASYLQEEIHNYYYGQCAEFCGDSHARMLFRATVVGDREFEAWVADEKIGHGTPDGRSWDEWYTAYEENPEQLTGDLNEGLKLFMGRAKCATCHTVKGNPRAVGVAGPNLTNVGARLSIAAGWLNHRAEDGGIDTEQQYENFFNWLKETDVIKPGNLMWEANGGGIGELIDEHGEPALLTDEEINKLSLYLQSLK